MQSPIQSFPKSAANVCSTPTRTFIRSESGPATTTPSQLSTGERTCRRLSSFTSPAYGKDKSLIKRSYSSGDNISPTNSPPSCPVSIPISPSGQCSPPRSLDHSPPRNIQLPSSEYELLRHKQGTYASDTDPTQRAPADNFGSMSVSTLPTSTSTPDGLVPGAELGNGRLSSHGPLVSCVPPSEALEGQPPPPPPGPPSRLPHQSTTATDTPCPQYAPPLHPPPTHSKFSPGIAPPPPRPPAATPRETTHGQDLRGDISSHIAPSHSPSPPSATALGAETRGDGAGVGGFSRASREPPVSAASGGNTGGWGGSKHNPSLQQHRHQLQSLPLQAQCSSIPGDILPKRPPRSPPRSRIDSNQMPRPRPADPHAPELIYHTKSSTGARKVPPASTAVFTCVDSGNATPRAVRVTSVAPPSTKALANKISMPLAVVTTPFALPENDENEVNVVDMKMYGSEEGNPPRCIKCRGYINPYVGWIQGGTKWICNMCGAVNNTESWYVKW